MESLRDKIRLPLIGSLLAVICALAWACAPAASSSVISGGTDVGNRSPAFAMQLADGSQVTSQALNDADQPALLFYFATW